MDARFAQLDDPARWPEAAGWLLADLGFVVVNGDRPGAPGGSNLLVALRERPTLQHFDPEVIRFWVGVDGRGRVAQLDRRTTVPAERRIAWGHVHVVDRLNVENRFLTFGGTLRAVALAPSLTVVQLRTPGPLVRWGGHSQPPDPLAGDVGAFFARLMVPVDFTSGAEAGLLATGAGCLYAAFLQDARTRHPGVADTGDEVTRWIRSETTRVATAAPDDWAAGAALRQELGLGG